MNITYQERLDNIVVYFSESASSEEITTFLDTLDLLEKARSASDAPLFNEWDIPTPFGEKILSTDKPIGAISYFPLRSSSQQMYFNNVPKANGVVMSGSAGKSPHSLLSSFHSIIQENKDSDLKALTQYISNIRISGPENEGIATDWNLIPSSKNYFQIVIANPSPLGCGNPERKRSRLPRS